MNVWVVLEYRLDKPNEKLLYGVFDTSEEDARTYYGDPGPRYGIEVIKCNTRPPDLAKVLRDRS